MHTYKKAKYTERMHSSNISLGPIVTNATGAHLSMDISILPQIDPLSTYYSNSFSSYKRRKNEYEKIFKWVSERFEEEITSQLVKKENENRSGTLSVLGIGSGDGMLLVLNGVSINYHIQVFIQ